MLGDDVLAHVAGRQPRRPRRRRASSTSGMVGRRAGLPRTASGSRPTCGSRPASSSRTSSPASAAARRWSRPGLAGLETTLDAAQRPAHRRPAGDLGRHRGQPGPRRRPGDRGGDRRRLRARRPARRRAADHAGVRRRRSWRCTPRALRRCPRARRCAPVDAPFDIVVTTNSGYPLDQNLYQAVKGMSAAAEIVRPGGTIICAAECRDGLPDHGDVRPAARIAGRSPAELLASASTPRR